ncbi:tetratricopeptide repeat protein [Stappia stellulata]|uniref:tetratricopeptide repeat protein n=1 Tax=Stappia stellulata TaxID=71235 RepID=UPI001CD71EF3|nr:tetratricopeptide repeat protein [Stappia stellulata]MCA1243682.1 tetratricopeptide repeat protein [Stappia stellulata]
MRSFSVCLLLLYLGGPALAQGEPPGVLPPEAEPPAMEDLAPLPESEIESGARAAIPDEDTSQNEVDALFDALAQAPSTAAARPIVAKIQRKWMQSGSATVDLLMSRAGTAMKAKDNALALDLLDMVTRLAPDYAEGWNRRATVYYLTQDFGRSIADIERTLALEPRHWGAMSGLGIIMRRLKRDKDAMRIFEEVLKIHPASENARKAVDDLATKSAGSPT